MHSDKSDKPQLTTQIIQSLPCIANLVLALLIEQICLVFSGHLALEDSKESFGALGISLFTLNTFCLSFGMGILGATDTLSSKAFGSDDRETCLKVFKRSQSVMFLLFVL